jgi:Trk K+ transport system NAD-binding subunit
MANFGWGMGPVERILPVAPHTDHYIICGAGTLAHRLVVELTEQYDVPVMAILPDRERDHAPHILKVLGESGVVVAPAIGEEALELAQASGARGIALVDGDDQSNIHAALRAQSINPGIRIVLRMYNQRLGEHIEKLFSNCAALSRSATAAPAFINAALRRPNSVQIGSRSVSIAQNDRIEPVNYLCTIADEIDQLDLTRMRLLPETPGSTAQWFTEVAPQTGAIASQKAVLQFLESEHSDSLSRISRLRWRLIDMWRFFTSVQLRMVLAASVALVIASFTVIWTLHRPFGWAAYETLLDIAGSAVPDNFSEKTGTGGTWQRAAQVAITLCGIPLMAVVTAILVENAGQENRGTPKIPSAGIRGHAVVVGLGNVGTRIASLLHELGVPVVCVERDPTTRGIAVARSLDIPVIVGEGPLDNQLRQARVQNSRAVLAVTGDDATNLEAVLEARAISPDVRVVLRLFDDDFATHVYRTFTNAASRSVSYLAAPAFAAALMGREVLGTLSVYRHVVLVAQFVAEPGTPLVGRTLREAEVSGEVRVIAVKPKDNHDYIWRPDHSRKLAAGDTYVVVATRTGLGRHTGLVS